MTNEITDTPSLSRNSSMSTVTSKSKSLQLRKPRRRPKKTPPISKLSYDILWYIFTFIQFQHDDTIDMSSSGLSWHDQSRDHEPSLIRFRRISQVCKYWRNLTFETPSFWAHAINLQHLNQKRDSWRKEVIKRTENAPLSVRGTVSKASEPSTGLLFSLMKNHWPRIRVLNLIIDDREVVHDPTWQILYHSAPSLEIFRIAVSPVSFRTEGTDLFSNSAPRLRFLSCDTGLLTPSGSTLWSSQVRTLIVSTFDLELPQMLEALNSLPLLETLQIRWKAFKGKGWDAFGQDWPIVKPPSLRILSLKNSYKHVGGFLQQIILPPTCRLLVEAINRSSNDVLSKTEIHILRSAFTTHFSNVVGPTRLYWTSSSSKFELAADTNSSGSGDPCFQVRFHLYDDPNLYSVVDIISLAFSTCALASNITELVISLGKPNQDPSNKNLLAFIDNLRSVETISIETESLELLIPILDNTPGSFPRLRTMVLQSGRTYHLKADVVMRFLMRRRDAGMAISVFDLRECRSPGQEKLLFLEGLDGLVVLWDPEIRNRIDYAYRDWTGVDSDD